MIAVFVRHKDNPAFRGTAFARDWTELFWVIDEQSAGAVAQFIDRKMSRCQWTVLRKYVLRWAALLMI